MNIALIDSDVIAYRAAILCEDADEADAIDLCDRIHETWLDAAHCDLPVRCLTVGKSFRVTAWPDYKANRASKPRPRHLQAVRQHIIDSGSMMHPSWEADDIMGFIHTGKPLSGEFSTVIVTVDKDLDQVPGWHCNPDKETVYEVSPEDSELYRWMQVLSGDTTDNYAGIPGIGEKKALKLLTDVPTCDLEKTVRAIYTEKELDDKYLSSMITCSSIIQYTEEIECALLSQDSSEESTLVSFLRSLRPPHFFQGKASMSSTQ